VTWLIAHVDVHENLFERVIQVPVVVGEKLPVPNYLARIYIKGER
jgi:hypothetical protein